MFSKIIFFNLNDWNTKKVNKKLRINQVIISTILVTILVQRNVHFDVDPIVKEDFHSDFEMVMIFVH